MPDQPVPAAPAANPDPLGAAQADPTTLLDFERLVWWDARRGVYRVILRADINYPSQHDEVMRCSDGPTGIMEGDDDPTSR